MIPYADLERAIARWKARQAGHDVPAAHHHHEVGDDAVVGEAHAYGEAVEGSGLITIDEDTKH